MHLATSKVACAHWTWAWKINCRDAIRYTFKWPVGLKKILFLVTIFTSIRNIWGRNDTIPPHTHFLPRTEEWKFSPTAWMLPVTQHCVLRASGLALPFPSLVLVALAADLQPLPKTTISHPSELLPLQLPSTGPTESMGQEDGWLEELSAPRLRLWRRQLEKPCPGRGGTQQAGNTDIQTHRMPGFGNAACGTGVEELQIRNVCDSVPHQRYLRFLLDFQQQKYSLLLL